MPWRKYPCKDGKFGPSYEIARGIRVRKDARGLWTLFIDKKGERKSKTLGAGTAGLTRAIRTAEKIAAKIGSYVVAKKISATDSKSPAFKDYSTSWLKGGISKWSEYTYERYEQILRLHLWPHRFFQQTIDKIGRSDVKRFLKEFAAKKAPATVESVHSVISGIFTEAIDDELIKANPALGLLKGILPPKNRRDVKAADPFSITQRDRFLSQAASSCRPEEVMALKVMAHMGLRLGEALAMRFEHLNLEQRTYFVAESYRCWDFNRPKAGKTRLVDLPDFLSADFYPYLSFLKKENLKKGRGGKVDLLFVDPDEIDPWPYSQRKIQALMRRVCKAAGLRVRNPHDLRHTYASILLMAHMSPGYVQRQLGHSSIAITMDIYCHWISGEGRGDLDAALSAQSGSCGICENMR